MRRFKLPLLTLTPTVVHCQLPLPSHYVVKCGLREKAMTLSTDWQLRLAVSPCSIFLRLLLIEIPVLRNVWSYQK